MDNKIKREVNEMKYLFGYERGRVISEQKEFPTEEEFNVLDNVDYDYDGPDFDIEYNREVETPVRPDVDTPTIPKTPRTPYKPKRKTKPKAKNEFLDEDMPGWLSFDELGLNFDEI